MSFDRRQFLSAAAATLLPAFARADAAPPKRVLRLAHVTDPHVQPELKAAEGLTACLRHLQSQVDKPALILTGGDHVMDAFAQGRARTKLQWDLYSRILQAECSLPAHAVLGNHDIWGWNKEKSKTTGTEPEYGKKWAVEALGMPGRYHSFARAGWHFIALDSVQPGAKVGSFSAYLDGEQFDWLKAELAKVPATTPVLIWSHIPIVSAWPVLAKRQTPDSEIKVSASSVHTDAGPLAKLFAAHPNVKACLSGHLHLVDRVTIRGVSYLCNGAVSGNWWKGPNEGFAEGYTLVDLYDDGSFRNEYVGYGWKAEPVVEKKG